MKNINVGDRVKINEQYKTNGVAVCQGDDGSWDKVVNSVGTVLQVVDKYFLVEHDDSTLFILLGGSLYKDDELDLV